MKLSSIALCALALGGCRNPVDTNFQYIIAEGAVRMEPPALYRDRWRAMEACSGLSGSFENVTWYHTPRLVLDGKIYDGGWLKRQNAIFIVDARLDNLVVIDHEITHALLQGGIDHPAQYFHGACGDLTTVRENPQPPGP